MNTPEVERAAEVAQGRVDDMYRIKGKTLAQDIAAALSAAGLLRTEADRMNAELAEAMVAYCETYGFRTGITLERDGPARDRVRAAIVAILDSRKPVERWQVGNGGAGLLYTVFEAGHPTNGIVGYFPSRGHAESFAKALNAEERAK